MATTRKYANLPDLDNAPDVYETPDLADDVSTLQKTTTIPSPTASSYDDAVERVTDDHSGVDRSKFTPNEARTRFGPSRVDATQVDFSDRASGVRRSYRTGTRKSRRGHNSGQYSDSSSDDDGDLDSRVAYLRREIEAVKVELAQKKEAEVHDEEPEERSASYKSVEQLSDALDAIYTEQHRSAKDAETDFAALLARYTQGKPTRQPSHSIGSVSAVQKSATIPLSNPQLAQALHRTAEFDTRLAEMESALGLDPSSSTPLLQTLSTMTTNIDLLQSTTAPSLENMISKARSLSKEAERLQQLRTKDDNDKSEAPDLADTTKVNALYASLPTIDALSPTLPMVLDRLRSLRTLHASAARAATTLDDLENRQVEQAVEIKQWREALTHVEEALGEGAATLGKNMSSVEKWVKELERRI